MRAIGLTKSPAPEAAGPSGPSAVDVDEADFDRFYLVNRLDFVRLARLLVDDLATAEDVTQEAFAAFFRRRGQLTDPSPTSDTVVAGMEREQVLVALARLPSRQREVLVLRYYSTCPSATSRSSWVSGSAPSSRRRLVGWRVFGERWEGEMSETVEVLTRAMRDEADDITEELLAGWPDPRITLPRKETVRRPARRRPVLVAALVAAAVVVGSTGLGLAARARSESKPSPVSAQGHRALTEPYATGLGPGCSVPSPWPVTRGSAGALGGKPVYRAVAGQRFTLMARMVQSPPGLSIRATLEIAAPGTLPGRGFVRPRDADGHPSLDDPKTALATATVDGTRAATLSVSFTPLAAAVYPVFSIVQGTNTVTPARICGGLPYAGGFGENIIAWVDVS